MRCLFACLMAGVVLAQPRRETDEEFRQTFATAPGGTPEERLWQVLVLAGTGDREPSVWDGSVRAVAGSIHAITA